MHFLQEPGSESLVGSDVAAHSLHMALERSVDSALEADPDAKPP
jgi:hypothetical protein